MGSSASLPAEGEEEENAGPDVFSARENAFASAENITDTRQNASRENANHSLDEAIDQRRRARSHRQMSIGAKYLAEENARLRLANDELTCNMKTLSSKLEWERIPDSDPDKIYGESLEQRLTRLEKHLASERREKWSAIENSERIRVDLVNCERELSKANESVQRLSAELEESRARVRHLEKATGRGSEEGEPSGTSQSRRESLSHFRADLRAKREARQRALSAISAEMNGLREQLQKEKAARRKLERDLETRNLNLSDVSIESMISDNNSLRNEIDILTENAERLQNVASENIKLKFEAKRLNAEMDSLNLNLGELKFEYYEEKRKHERTLRKLKELEKNSERSVTSTKNDWEEEREKFFEKYDQEKEEMAKRTNALKEVISITRQMLAIRESQVQELMRQLKDIEESVKRTKILEENGLKAEYEKQLENIRNLKTLYEERVRLMESERQKLDQSIQEKSQIIQDQESELEGLRNQLECSNREIKFEREENETLDREFRLTVAKCKDLENELNLINNLFTQMLLGPFNTGNETDLDKLTELLQENHDLIAEMTTREESSEIASVLPKLLLDLITQVEGPTDKIARDCEMTDSCETISEQSESLLAENQGAVLPILSFKDAKLFKQPRATTVEPSSGETPQQNDIKCNENISPAVQEIASNLPKVWKILMELLSHHSTPEEPSRGDEKQCYKKVDTPNGPRTVISVSKTFIRLKDLILQKKALQKELTRLKQLNLHLESRLDDQEKRLSQVQCELHKTWGIVGRMRAQHQQLHNHEKILRYELQEKRIMLSELKQELEYCRDKWERARQKNDDTETEWKKLRREFAARKTKGYSSPTLNDSGESGFSDEHNESGEDFDADRSSTQSPVDGNLLEDEENAANLLVCCPSDEGLLQEQQKEDSTAGANFRPEEDGPEVSEENGPSTSRPPERDRAREARDLRLKKLEEQCKLLVRQVDITSHKSNFLNNRLEELHEQYGATEDNRRRNEPQASLDVPTITAESTHSETNEEFSRNDLSDDQADSTNEQEPNGNSSSS